MIPGADVLFVPGHDVKKQAKAAQLPTTLILDLEDSVPPGDKPRAREVIRGFFASDTARPGSRLVRVNSLRSPYLLDDLAAITGLPIAAVVIPKVEEPDVVRIVSELLAPGTGIDVYALLETARGVSRASEIAAAGSRLRGLMFGHADLANDLGIRTERPLAGALGHARACVATAARGAGLVAYDTPYENFRDPDGLRAEAREAVALGYAGKLAIHPDQVPVIRDAWRPDPAEVERARRVLEAWDHARAAGSVVAVLDGALVERQMAESARRVLAQAEQTTP